MPDYGTGAGAGIAEGLAPLNDMLLRMVGARFQAKEVAKNKAGMQVLKTAMTENPELIGTPEFDKSMKSLLGSDTYKELQPTLEAFANNPHVQAQTIAKTAMFGGVDVQNPTAITDALKGLGITTTGGMMAHAPQAAEATAAAPTTKVALKDLPQDVAAGVLRKRFATESGPMVAMALDKPAYGTLAQGERKIGDTEQRLALDAFKAGKTHTVYRTVKDGDTQKLVSFEIGPDGKQLNQTVQYEAPRQLPKVPGEFKFTTQTMALSRALQSQGQTPEQAKATIQSGNVPKSAIAKAQGLLKTTRDSWKQRLSQELDNRAQLQKGLAPRYPSDPLFSSWKTGMIRQGAQGNINILTSLMDTDLGAALGGDTGGAAPAAPAAPTVNPPVQSGPMKLPNGSTFEPLQ